MDVSLTIELAPGVIALLDELVELGLWGASREATAANLVTQAVARMMETPGFAPLLREAIKRRRED
jgi:hypothetical protein